ncbi:hypothetical protein [Deinococcus maricopensis]|uniref:DUF4388 domain-containing protein n=1 Tax=Deinococcus maricopensis (strain DSM 21211 / LMG 22137 / NRRL B-23946 / LB-34) TaxID=709986 RepID=E8U4D9_DEIML|nr:hypothetical protein [Deinococcus maricopensis]ADV65976.1 hypothetical protein Deima_0315 [Deinococcus maricopensis DSM 21211]
MSIFGELEHHAFTDLMRVLHAQSGTLYLQRSYHGRSVDLDLERGVLLHLHIDGVPVPDAASAGDVIHHLIHSGRGPFEFQARPFTPGATALALPLEPLVQDILEGVHTPERHLPHMETRFTCVSAAQATPPAHLTTVWALVQPHFVQGCSAATLAQVLGIGALEARNLTYRLRSAQLIVPLRAADVPVTAGDPERAPLTPVRRFLNALRRLTGAVNA